MAFDTPDAAILELWGEAAIHTPAGGSPTGVIIARVDTSTLPDVAANTLIIFGTITDSGFAQRPIKNDSITYGGETFRIFEVKQDSAGGTLETAGLHLYLTK